MTTARSTTQQDAFGGGVAVITGAGAGIGEGLARHAATRLGMTVVLADIDEPAIERVRTDVEAAGGRAIAVPTDVRDPDALERLADRTDREAGPVRLLVNNAGIEQFGYLWDVPVANWRRIVDVNISGVFHGIRAFVPRMLATDQPSYLWNLSSIGGVSAAPLQAPYIMTKHAVLGLTESLSLEMQLAQAPIRVSAILPGAVASQIFHAAGGVETGDQQAAEQQRAQMLEIAAHAMDPAVAAETIFQQAAEGEFYIVTHPDLCLDVMRRRAEQLAGRRAPQLQPPRDISAYDA
jgi:NAD(P)-dependent dehydrogenase (short-subunit alcohol dehydrogenase family)